MMRLNKSGSEFNSQRCSAWSALVLVCAALGGGLEATACLIPVFQYAMENWSADAYRVVVRGDTTTDEAQAGLKMLEKVARDGVNVELVQNERTVESFAMTGSVTTSRMEVFYPARSGTHGPVWAGALNRETVSRLLDSPARREIAAHLLKGKAAVWVLLESGNRRNDRRAMQTLKKESVRFKQMFKVDVPEPGTDVGEIQMEIDFATVRVNRDDPAEQALVEMLLGLEPDLRNFKDQPMVFPVYGQGLMLYALVGEGINPLTLADVAGFLTGPCSCQVKAANPGMDILLAPETAVQKRARPNVTLPIGGPAGFLQKMREAGKK